MQNDIFFPVDTHFSRDGIIVVGRFYSSNNDGPVPVPPPHSLREAFHLLPESMRQIWGTVYIPDDDGKELKERILNKNKLFGASDAAFKKGKASHAWILSSGDVDNISPPDLHIAGSGPVDGHSYEMPSTRGEIHEVTAMSIMAQLFLNFHSISTPVEAICDNKGVINMCSFASFNHLKNHRERNTDLFFTQRSVHRKTPIQLLWIKEHSNRHPWKSIEDLKSQKLSCDEIYNVWCDYMAGCAWEHSTPIDDPDIMVAERWALYSIHPTYHKIIGQLTDAIYSALRFQELHDYVTSKHDLPLGALEQVNLNALKNHLGSLKHHNRATVTKLSHGWHPAYSILCRQGHAPSPLCPRCHGAIETSNHISTCMEESALTHRHDKLRSFLLDLGRIHTSRFLLTTFEYKLSITLNLPDIPQYQMQELLSPESRHYFSQLYIIKTYLDGTCFSRVSNLHVGMTSNAYLLRM